MANLLWGRVYYGEHFAGYLREEPGYRTSFTYDSHYQDLPAISHMLPVRPEPYISQSGLLPFFDNLVAEGWLEVAQTRLLGKRQATRFELLLAFGQDCAGAVSIVDPEYAPISQALMDADDPMELAVMTSRASLSGIQPKLALIKSEGKLRPARAGEVSTYIAKFPSQHHDDLVVNEYLTTLAFKSLLPDDNVVDLSMGEIDGFPQEALIIKRFDRGTAGERFHFEEFTQLLGLSSNAKYSGSHKDMADFIKNTPNCLPLEIYNLYRRILAGLLLGNTDMHLKNFAMFHTPLGLRLTPAYDEVAATIYNYKTLALAIGGSRDLHIGDLKPGNIIKLAEEFQLSKDSTQMAFEQLAKNKDAAIAAIAGAKAGKITFKNQLIDAMEKRWNGTFALIGQSLWKRR